jgi:release factor glutamine methyltransferase
MTHLLSDEIARATARLAAAGIPSPRADAEELAAFVHGVKRSELHAVPDAAFDARFWEGIARREAGEPLQHITGRAFFRYLELRVGPGVFVPRPETELLAGAAIEALSAGELAVDLCSGSGAVALAIAQEAPGVTVHAVELDPLALAWAERNVAATGLPVTLHRGDVADPALLASLAGTVDVVTANPPYIPIGAGVEREVAEHDPPAALWGGVDGLDVVRAVERAAARLLRPGGLVAVEHADAQGSSVPAVFRGWSDVADHRDLAGRPRYTTARRP